MTVAAVLLGFIAASVLLSCNKPDKAATSAAGSGFQERAKEAGIAFRMNFLPNEQGEHFKINLYDHGCGVAVGDYDGDGHDDIYFLNQLGQERPVPQQGRRHLRGRHREGRRRRSATAICVGATFADYDNDGCQDLFVTSTRGGNVLFHNRGDGTFKDVTTEAGADATSATRRRRSSSTTTTTATSTSSSPTPPSGPPTSSTSVAATYEGKADLRD